MNKKIKNIRHKNPDKYIKRLEIKIGLMRYFVPAEKENIINNRVINAVK